jgi:threonine synthase
MLCRSTRASSDDPDRRVWSLSEAMSAGLAPDGGLFVPVSMPRIDPADFEGWMGVTGDPPGVAAVATRLLAPFFADDPLEPHLEDICHEALDLPVPLVDLEGFERPTALMELFHGPSAAFKDFGARFLASCMSRMASDSDRPLTILVATSGDTGGAVAAAFYDKPGVEVVVLYPKGRVSERQAHQLSCWGGNITTLAVEGDFDACQAMVKQAFVDPACNEAARLTSANSINIGRLLPQMAYHAASVLQRPGWSIVVPTGNLGNGLAAIWARRVGMPISEVVLATNANDTLPRYAQTRELEPHPTVATLANAMDVSKPSNLERYEQLDGPLWDGVRAFAVDDDTIRQTIPAIQEQTGQVVCPHTATALHIRPQIGLPCLVAATAHPSKFDTVVEPLIGEEVPIPPALAELLERDRIEHTIPAELAALRDVLAS